MAKCALCGADPAPGFALIGSRRYCHGESAKETCFMKAASAPTRKRSRYLVETDTAPAMETR